MLARLDPLAREVIYSKRHLLEQPHRMSRSETLQEVAQAYDVPWQLLANINGIQDPLTILPGTELKVVRGPFRAEVNLTLKELTLFMGDYYAGRFPIAVGNDPLAVEGSYTIQDKQTGKTFYNRSGNPVAPAAQPIHMEISGWIWATRSAFMAALIPLDPTKTGVSALRKISPMTCTAFCRGVHL